jgi:hypothetical protein
MGTIYHKLFQDIRYFTFKSQYVIFYQEIPNGIEIFASSTVPVILT